MPLIPVNCLPLDLVFTEGNTGFSSELSSSASTIMTISESSAEEEMGATELDILKLFRTNSICKVFKIQSIYLSLSVCLSVCLFVCLYPINVKTAEPIRPKFCVGPQVVPGKISGQCNLKIFLS